MLFRLARAVRHCRPVPCLPPPRCSHSPPDQPLAAAPHLTSFRPRAVHYSPARWSWSGGSPPGPRGLDRCLGRPPRPRLPARRWRRHLDGRRCNGGHHGHAKAGHGAQALAAASAVPAAPVHPVTAYATRLVTAGLIPVGEYRLVGLRGSDPAPGWAAVGQVAVAGLPRPGRPRRPAGHFQPEGPAGAHRTRPGRARAGSMCSTRPASVACPRRCGGRSLAGCTDYATALRRAADLIPEGGSSEGERWDAQARGLLGRPDARRCPAGRQPADRPGLDQPRRRPGPRTDPPGPRRLRCGERAGPGLRRPVHLRHERADADVDHHDDAAGAAVAQRHHRRRDRRRQPRRPRLPRRRTRSSPANATPCTSSAATAAPAPSSAPSPPRSPTRSA